MQVLCKEIHDLPILVVHKNFMLFARLVKVLGAFPRKTSPSIINCALTLSQPERHCTNSISRVQDDEMTSQCLSALCKCASRFSCHVTSSELLTQLLKRGSAKIEELGKHCFFVNVSTRFIHVSSFVNRNRTFEVVFKFWSKRIITKNALPKTTVPNRLHSI